MRFSALVTSGVASMAAQMLVEGTTTRSSLQIADELVGLGVNLNAGADLDVIRVSMSALKDKLDPALAIYSDVVLHPSFPQSDLDRVKKIQLANIQQEKLQPFTMGCASRLFSSTGRTTRTANRSPAAARKRV